jgi:hypothetical protein
MAKSAAWPCFSLLAICYFATRYFVVYLLEKHSFADKKVLKFWRIDMRWFVVLAAGMMLVCFGPDAIAKSKSTKTADANAPKKPAVMNEHDLKEAQKKLEKFQDEAVKHEEDLRKELYSVRALAIKEHADETLNAIDEAIARQDERLKEAVAIAPMKNPPEPVKEPNSTSKKPDKSKTKKHAKS